MLASQQVIAADNPVNAIDWNGRSVATWDGTSDLKGWFAELAALDNPIRREFHLFTLLSGCRPARCRESNPVTSILDAHGAYPKPKGGASGLLIFPLSRNGLVPCAGYAFRPTDVPVAGGRMDIPADSASGTSSSKRRIEPRCRSGATIFGRASELLPTAAGVSEFDAKLLMNHAIPGVNLVTLLGHKHASRCEPVFRGDPMADISKFSIVTYERKPGHWRAGRYPEGPRWDCRRGDKVRSIVTPDDYASESEAQVAAEKLIRKL